MNDQIKDQDIKTEETDNQRVNADGMVVQKLKTRSIQKKEYEHYLKEIAKNVVGDTYYGDGWEVTLSQEHQDKLGCCYIVAMDLTVAAKEEIFDDFLMTLRKNFLRGGA